MSQASAVATRHKGVVKWFNSAKGYGFISSETALPDGKDIFVHYTGIAMSGYRSLREGEVVEFSVEEGTKGKQAASVLILDNAEGEDSKEHNGRKERSRKK